jgi:hypothetical protein
VIVARPVERHRRDHAIELEQEPAADVGPRQDDVRDLGALDEIK